jgi:hypothetical protein
MLAAHLALLALQQAAGPPPLQGADPPPPPRDPPLQCDVGPLLHGFGGSLWIVYSRVDGETRTAH